ncbi:MULTISPECIES: MFS transporter [Halomonas]|uniref:MFS transporter n=1 Tax=Halomonas TaxID=2745 RepID=UPI001C9692A6|nr:MULTISPECIES: MFS transporter [Halomonas]MBY6208631.1 MFS transporter [Halomonas sp. DP3Y7-2]MBY6227102.1 MFS transporter [Halomonas sp. DP3Y7-1]MCA0915149.1 MFS transporter [Halomonas denitrificans]
MNIRSIAKSSVYATTAIFFTNGLVLGMWATNIPAISKTLGLTDGQLGAALSMFAVGTMLMIFLAGSVANKMGSRAAIVLGGIALSMALPALVFSPSYEIFFLILLMFGVANSIIDVSMNTHGSIIEAKNKRPYMSSFHAAFSFGGMAGAGLVSLLNSLGIGAVGNMVTAATLMGVVTLASAAPLLHLRPEEATEREKKRVLVRPNPYILLIAGLTVLALFTESTMINWSSKFLTDVASTDTSIAAFAFGGFSFAMGVGRLIGNRLVRRYGHDKVLAWSGFIAAFGCALALLVPTMVVAILGFMLVGLGLANATPILYSCAGRAFPAAPSLGLAMNGTIGYLGFLVGPPIIGFASDRFGLQYTMVLPLVGMLVVGLVAMGRRIDKQALQHSQPM